MHTDPDRRDPQDNVIDFSHLARQRRHTRTGSRRKKRLVIAVLALLAAGAVALVGYQLFLATGNGGFWGNFAP